jgi:GxxExxY protein
LGAAFEVHNTLGYGFLEKVYENPLMAELRLRGVEVEQQRAFTVSYKGEKVGDYFCDLLVAGKVIVEVKAAAQIADEHIAQTLNYLRATGLKVGLVLNFGKTRLEYKRLVL